MENPRNPSASPETCGTHSAPVGSYGENPYPDEVVRKLNALTGEFYAREAASFSATRQAPWHGWEKAWEAITAEDPAFACQPLTVLDLGCGNLRFGRFLAAETAGPVTVHAFDNCPALAHGVPRARENDSAAADAPPVQIGPPGGAADSGPNGKVAISFAELDFVESLLDGTFATRLPAGTCDLAVAFGLMHHLPAFGLRIQVLRGLLDSLRPGGFAIASFWQFLNDARLAAKAETATAAGRARHDLPPFGSRDRLLGWQDNPDVFRFCHHADDGEIDALLGTLSAPYREIARFSADGRAGDLNRYIILQRL